MIVRRTFMQCLAMLPFMKQGKKDTFESLCEEFGFRAISPERNPDFPKLVMSNRLIESKDPLVTAYRDNYGWSIELEWRVGMIAPKLKSKPPLRPQFELCAAEVESIYEEMEYYESL